MSLEKTLTQAYEGLLMPSESDFPFEFFCWEGQAQEDLTPPKILQLAAHPTDSPIETVGLEDIFRNVAQEKEWHDEIQKENVTKFQRLIETLNQNLSDIQVYRIGTMTIDVYIVGKTQSGDLAGLSTKLVET